MVAFYRANLRNAYFKNIERKEKKFILQMYLIFEW